jgi:hypothetical protein
MNLVPVSIDSIVIGQPLPCALRDVSGVLLASQGFQVHSRQDLEAMVGRRSEIYIDSDESENYRRGYFNRLNKAVMQDHELRKIAEVQISPYDNKKAAKAETNGEPDWIDLQTQMDGMLRDFRGDSFLPRLERLQKELERTPLQRNPDGTLFALIHLAGSEIRRYSATHAMLVSTDVSVWPRATCSSGAKTTLQVIVQCGADHVHRDDRPAGPHGHAKGFTNGGTAQTASTVMPPARWTCCRMMGVTNPLVARSGAVPPPQQAPGPLAPRTVSQRLATPDPARRHVCRPPVTTHLAPTRDAQCRHAGVLL